MAKTLRDAGEQAVVRRLVALSESSRATPVMDDCAVIRAGGKHLVLTTDILAASTHFPEGAGPELIGWHSAAVTFSDVAAMGARPLGLLLALSMPHDTEVKIVEGVMRGAKLCADSCGSHIVGGDTKEGKEFVACTSALGIVESGRPLMRSGCRKGDMLCHTGKIGRAALWQLRGKRSLVEPMLRFQPRVGEGMALQALGATSCIDLSDGLALSTHYLAEASGVGFGIDLDVMGFHEGLRRGEKEKALYLGGDYELLFTVPRAKAHAAIEELMALGTEAHVIGEAKGKGVMAEAEGKARKLPKDGYEHFKS
ncbi:MAG: thiamine-phosphate kinase [Euryarchaeota archaeon]|nr:thiamine-phosphate kinase [Euryarchaeota archaeon]